MKEIPRSLPIGLARDAGPYGAGGFTLVSAVFLTVVLVALGASLMNISAVQQTTTAQQLQSVRATYAARAGLEWAIGKANAGICAGTTSLAAGTLQGQLAPFAVTITCTSTDHDVGTGTPRTYYTVDVTATSGAYGTPDFVLRRVQAKVGG